MSKMFDRIKNPPRGRHGGGEGRSAKVYLKGNKVLNGMGRELIPAGKTLVLETAGGGGLGKAENRDPKSKEKDKKERLATSALPEFAEKVFMFLRLGKKT